MSGVGGGDDTTVHEVATLPAHVATRLIFVSSQASLLEAVRFVEIFLGEAGPAPWAERTEAEQKGLVVGLDSEWRPSFLKGQVHKTSIFQIAFTDKVLIFDLRWAGERPDCIHRAGAWALVRRILHAAPLLKIGVQLAVFARLHRVRRMIAH